MSTVSIRITTETRKTLEATLSRAFKAGDLSMVKRVTALLGIAREEPIRLIAAGVGVSPSTVYAWLRAFLVEGVAGLRVPQTGIQGKFCMPYLVARALIDGKISLHAFTEAAVRDPKILQFAEKVQMNLDTALKKKDAAGRPCRTTVRLKNGQTYTREAQHAKGGPELPMTEDELRGKFTECAREVMSDSSAQQVLENIERLETLDSVKPLCEMLRG